MILALVDDLLFGSRIRAAADRAGRALVFAGRGAVAQAVQASRPHLVVIDLDRSPVDPMSAIREIKSHVDPAISSVKVVGFVSHVRGDLIDAARAAGIDVVLARSAFVAKLPDLIAGTPADAAPAEGDADAVTGAPAPTIADVEAAARRIASFIWHTPMIRSAWLSSITGAEVWLKLESVQTTGSYKMRGATNALTRLTERLPDADTVVTASAGNHGLAVAYAAKHLGLRARVHVPATAPSIKKDSLSALGATVIEAPTYDDAETRGRQDAESRRTTFLSAYSHSDVIAGAGTVALEMLTDEPSLDTIVVPLGGGGLLSGAAIVARALQRNALVIGAEAEASPVFTSALAAGRVVTVRVHETLADGLAGNMEPDSQTFRLVRDLVDHVALVAESSIALAMRELIRRERLVVEGAGAAGVGALLQRGVDLKGRRVGVILSGRNVDGDAISRVLCR